MIAKKITKDKILLLLSVEEARHISGALYFVQGQTDYSKIESELYMMSVKLDKQTGDKGE